MTRKREKVFVLDTNVILHDSSCLTQFEENTIVIPITVLEELDHFKKGNDSINFHAREFCRALDAMSGDKLFEDGVRVNPNGGRLVVRLEQEMHHDLTLSFSDRKPDHQILNIAYRLARENRNNQVVLVSKDVNLRVKAKSIGLLAQDYKTDQVMDISTLYTGKRTEEGIPNDVIRAMYADPCEVSVEHVPLEPALTPNEYLILRNGKHSALATFNALSRMLRRVDKVAAYGIVPLNAEQTFALHALLNPDIRLVTISGKAGTGKTLLALAAALERRKDYLQILMARPVVPLSNKDLGFLPGDISSKLDPYMQPLFDNLGVIKNQYAESATQHKRVKEMLDKDKLVIAPLAYIRGRSLVRIFFIVDEAQNLTPHEIKTILTRAGQNTKMVFTGDIHQIDHPYLDARSNGLSYLIDRMKGQKLYAHVTLEKGERSELADLASDLL